MTLFVFFQCFDSEDKNAFLATGIEPLLIQRGVSYPTKLQKLFL